MHFWSVGVNEIWCEAISHCSARTHEAFSALVWNGLSFDDSVNAMLLFGVWKTNFFFISSLINIYPFPFIVFIKLWHMIQAVLSVKALVLVGLWEVLAGFPSESLAQKMHSALVFFLPLMHQLYAQAGLLKKTPSDCFTSSIAVWP